MDSSQTVLVWMVSAWDTAALYYWSPWHTLLPQVKTFSLHKAFWSEVYLLHLSDIVFSFSAELPINANFAAIFINKFILRISRRIEDRKIFEKYRHKRNILWGQPMSRFFISFNISTNDIHLSNCTTWMLHTCHLSWINFEFSECSL